MPSAVVRNLWGGRGSQISSANKVLYSSEAEGGEGRNAAKISPTFLLLFFFYKDKCFNSISALKKKSCSCKQLHIWTEVLYIESLERLQKRANSPENAFELITLS